jgi:hypothetical protein
LAWSASESPIAWRDFVEPLTVAGMETIILTIRPRTRRPDQSAVVEDAMAAFADLDRKIFPAGTFTSMNA